MKVKITGKFTRIVNVPKELSKKTLLKNARKAYGIKGGLKDIKITKVKR